MPALGVAAAVVWGAGLGLATNVQASETIATPTGTTSPIPTRAVPTVPLADPARPTKRPTRQSEPLKKTGKKSEKKTAGASTKEKTKKTKPSMTMAIFLDRLMLAESSGVDTAKNPRSTATGSFQFIESTWLDVMRRHFPARIAKLSRPQILALRTDRETARKAAEAFTRDNAAILASDGHAPTFPNLRLAFLLGAGAASRVLAMEPNAPVAPVLGRTVVRANPFLARMTALDLLAKAARDLDVPVSAKAQLKVAKRARGKRRAAGPRIRVKCNLRRASCRRWLALKRRQLKSKDRRIRRAALRATR
ncbi:MAG: hypothetical protein AAFY27_07475 [Pseudomonadota bacterium]